MKSFTLIFSFIAIVFTAIAQPRLTMSNYRNFTPGDTVAYGTNVNLQVFVKNTGSSLFSGNIKLTAKRDTLGALAIGLDTVFLNSVTILPGDSIPGVLQFVPTPTPTGAFKVMGNGNVIVVWPVSGATLLGDSVRPVLYINGTAGLTELKPNEVFISPNPSSNYINVKIKSGETPKHYVLYDVFGRKVKELEWLDKVDVSDLSDGIYWLILYTENKYYKTKIIKQ